MDARVAGETSLPTVFPTWDLAVEETPPGSGQFIVPMLTGNDEAAQQAQVSTFLIVGLIPQLPTVGVDWLGFLSAQTAFGDLDAQIRKSIAAGGHNDFFPDYDVQEQTLVAIAKRRT